MGIGFKETIMFMAMTPAVMHSLTMQFMPISNDEPRIRTWMTELKG